MTELAIQTINSPVYFKQDLTMSKHLYWSYKKYRLPSLVRNETYDRYQANKFYCIDSKEMLIENFECKAINHLALENVILELMDKKLIPYSNYLVLLNTGFKIAHQFTRDYTVNSKEITYEVSSHENILEMYWNGLGWGDCFKHWCLMLVDLNDFVKLEPTEKEKSNQEKNLKKKQLREQERQANLDAVNKLLGPTIKAIADKYGFEFTDKNELRMCLNQGDPSALYKWVANSIGEELKAIGITIPKDYFAKQRTWDWNGYIDLNKCDIELLKGGNE